MVGIDPRLERRPDEPVIVKPYPSCFFRTDLHERLRAAEVDTLIIAGCTTSVCVRATAIDAMQHGYRPILAAQAIGEFDPAIHAIHLRDLDARYADVTDVDDVLQQLDGYPR
jgi:nicotinamidase-related amidase